MAAESPDSPFDREVLCLIGYRGTGKTSVAQELANRIGWNWIDSDHVIEEDAGRTIAAIFAEDGEDGFRALEEAAVKAVLGVPGRVVSVGGGAVLREANRRCMAERAAVVWLKAEPETILARLNSDVATASQRPNLTADGGLQEIQFLLQQRGPLYCECADLEVDTEGKDVATVATEILDRIHSTSDGA